MIFPFVAMKCVIAKSDYRADVRKKETEMINNYILKDKRLYILSGPKHVGKSYLVKKIADGNDSVLLVDLTALNSEESVLATIIKIARDFLERIKKVDLNSNSVNVEFRETADNKESHSPRSAVEAVRVLLNSNSKPLCVIVDEAQTLKYLKESNIAELIALLTKCGRDHSVSVLLVTSDYSSLISTTGMVRFHRLMFLFFIFYFIFI